MRINLRPVSIEDGNNIVKWRNSPKVSSHCFDRTPVTLKSNKRFFEENVLTGKYKQFIVERIDEDFGVFSYPIATVYLKDMDKINRRCQLCIFTSDDQEWNNESQSIAIRQLLEKAFTEYDMHKVYSYVFENNIDEVQLLVNSGLSKEAVLKDEVIDSDGRAVNILRMCIFNEQFLLNKGQ